MRLRDRRFPDLQGLPPLWPLLGFVALAVCAVAADPRGTEWRFVLLAGAVLGVCVLLVTTGRESARLTLIVALAALVVIALLRESQGGSASGYSPLAMLVVVWVAVVLDARAVLLMALCSGLMFALPLLLIGPPMYPSTGWRGASLWTLVAYLVGVLVHSTVAAQREQAASATRHAHELGEMQAAIAAVAAVSRDLSLGTDTRERVCSTAVAITDATFATVVEPVGGRFAITGAAGIPMGADDLRSVQPEASLAAYRTTQRVFVPDVATDARVSPVIVRATGISSALFQPIVRGGHSVGVLCVAWTSARESLDARTSAVIEFLAAEAGAAIERADLLARLDEQARSDQLTALPNRRAWDETLADATRGHAAVCVAMIDIDHFKQFNDVHGHAAGDRLLRACALAWKSHLRPSDTLARYGGEEFAVLLPDCSLADATLVLERLRRATPSAVTASVGVAERHPAENDNDVMARADAALYRAKDTGRNQLQAA